MPVKQGKKLHFQPQTLAIKNVFYINNGIVVSEIRCVNLTQENNIMIFSGSEYISEYHLWNTHAINCLLYRNNASFYSCVFQTNQNIFLSSAHKTVTLITEKRMSDFQSHGLTMSCKGGEYI